MKLRYLGVFCLICILLSRLVFTVSANYVVSDTYGECGENAKWSLSDSGVLTISGTGAIHDYIYEGYEMWPDVKAPWRTFCNQVKKIIIEPGITEIGKNAFCCLPNVTSVSISNTVKVIGQAAFSDNTKLNNVVVPDSVTTVSKSAFKKCTALTNITLPSGITSLGEQAFSGCTKLSSITLPQHITEIHSRTFDTCTSMKSIIIPNGVIQIKNSAFANSGLTSIQLPYTLQKISPNAFANSKLTQITIPSSVTHILQSAFSDCNKLNSIVFTGAAPEFDSHVFENINATVFYPNNAPSWSSDIRQDYGGNITWLASCGSSHTWDQWTTTYEANCASAGKKTRKCTKCDMTQEESVPKTKHQYSSVVTPPTCKDDGFTIHTCKVCNHSYKDNKTPAGSHTFSDWVTVTPSTCLQKGKQTRSCTICETTETGEAPLGDHSYQDEITPPSCIKEGFTTHTCTVCQDTVVDSYTATVPHTFGQWTETKAPSTSQYGEQYRNCLHCSRVETAVIPKLPFNWTPIIAICAIIIVSSVSVVVIIKKKSI